MSLKVWNIWDEQYTGKGPEKFSFDESLWNLELDLFEHPS